MITHVRGFIEYEDTRNVAHYHKGVDLAGMINFLAVTVGLHGFYEEEKSRSTLTKFLPSAPRGLPRNLSLRGREIRATWSSDGYSSSWLTLEELYILMAWSAAIFVEGSATTAVGACALIFKTVVSEVAKISESGIGVPRLVYWFETED